MNCSSVSMCVPFVQNAVVVLVVLPPMSTLSVVTMYVAVLLWEFPAKSVAVQV